MKHALPAAVLIAVSSGFAASASAAVCGEGTLTRTALAAAKSAPPSGAAADALARDALACLASPDPVLRDELGFELLSKLIRAGAVSPAALRGLADALVPELRAGIGERSTDTVFRRAFAALVLSEIVRQDTRERALDEPTVRRVLDAAVAYLPAERDLRARDDRRGWMHGVAHGADLLWRLAANPRLNAADHERLLAALATKIAPEGTDVYTNNEGDRLARVVTQVLVRGLVPKEKLIAWVRALGEPGPLGSWGSAFASDAGMARLHNTKLFVRALHGQLTLGDGQAPQSVLDVIPALTDVATRFAEMV